MTTDFLPVLPYQDIEVFVTNSCGNLFDVTVNDYILYMSLKKYFLPSRGQIAVILVMNVIY